MDQSGAGWSWDRWLAEVRVQDVVHRRMSERWLRQQAEEEGSFAGVLVDLGERGANVALHVLSGRSHRGQILQVGADFVGLRVSGGGMVFVGLRAVSVVRTLPGEALVTGDRPVASRLRLSEVVAGLAAERERALFVVIGADPVCGAVRAVGQDVVVVRLDGDGPGRSATAYLPWGSIVEVVPGV